MSGNVAPLAEQMENLILGRADGYHGLSGRGEKLAGDFDYDPSSSLTYSPESPSFLVGKANDSLKMLNNRLQDGEIADETDPKSYEQHLYEEGALLIGSVSMAVDVMEGIVKNLDEDIEDQNFELDVEDHAQYAEQAVEAVEEYVPTPEAFSAGMKDVTEHLRGELDENNPDVDEISELVPG